MRMRWKQANLLWKNHRRQNNIPIHTRHNGKSSISRQKNRNRHNEQTNRKINEYKKLNPEIRTYLGASKGKESFYEKFGFISRPNEDLGAGMILYDA